MNVREKLQLNSGGQWLVSPVATKQIFCRETFTEEHKEIKKWFLNLLRIKFIQILKR